MGELDVGTPAGLRLKAKAIPPHVQVGRNQLASAITELLLQRDDGKAVVELFADPGAAPVPLDALISEVMSPASTGKSDGCHVRCSMLDLTRHNPIKVANVLGLPARASPDARESCCFLQICVQTCCFVTPGVLSLRSASAGAS